MPELIKGDIDSPHVDHPLIKDHPGEMSEQIDIYLAHLIKRALSARPEWIHSDGTLKEALLKGYERVATVLLERGCYFLREDAETLLNGSCTEAFKISTKKQDVSTPRLERFLLDTRAQPVSKRSSSTRL